MAEIPLWQIMFSIHVKYLFLVCLQMMASSGRNGFILYCDGFAQSIAKQRLVKHVPTRNCRSSVFYVVRYAQ
jgi:hypothetical protein